MKITDGLYSIGQHEGGRVHAFLVDSIEDGGMTLIDTGYDKDAGHILAELQLIGKTPADIKRIVLTHAHKSHVSGLAMMARLSNAVIYAHEDEIDIIEGRKKAAKVGWRIPKPFNLEVMGLQTALNLGIGSHEPYKVSQRIKDGDRLGPLECIGVPGHTPGSIALWWSARRVLFTGDTVSSWPVNPEISWPTFDLDHAQAQKSVGKMAELSTAQILCVGHGNPITYGAADTLKQLSAKPLG
jgi:glyoxylase-like metal-dependent hydrolase (beta-lactamase superfamily II)